MPRLQEAARAFIEALPGEHQVALYAFDGRADLQEVSGFTVDRVDLLQAVDALAAFETADRSTNLNGGLVEGLRLLDRRQDASSSRIFAASLVLFTDGTDQAARVSDDNARAAVTSTKHSVLTIGLGGEIDAGHLAGLGKDGFEIAANTDEIVAAFGRIALKIELWSKRFYMLGYCSPKRAGRHRLTLEATGREGLLEFDFGASGFEEGCNADLITDLARRGWGFDEEGEEGEEGEGEEGEDEEGEGALAPEVCNGLDDDGDGRIDEVDHGVDELRVTFDVATVVDPGQAEVSVAGRDGEPIPGSPFTGDELAGATVPVPGNLVRIRLLASPAATGLFGYRVTRIENADGTVAATRGLPESPHDDDSHTHAVPLDDERTFELADSVGAGLTCGSDVGECSVGRTRCLGGSILCADDARPAEEVCDGLDNDCDGSVDEAEDLAADPADLRAGICVGSAKRCLGAEGWREPDYLAIEGYEAEEASCDGLDNDCDGEADEDLAAPEAALAMGVCVGQVRQCAGADRWREPDYLTIEGYEAEEASCDGLDNDCDGEVDEVEGCDPCDWAEPPEGWVCLSPTGPEGFAMGSPAGEPERSDDEALHGVVLTRAFLMSATEVTQDSWVAMMGDNPARFDGCGECPVETVSWLDAAGYCNALSEREGLDACYEIDGGGVVWAEGLDCGGYRLPTEAEWEYAARAGTVTAYHSGPAEADLARVGWYDGNSGRRTHPVAGKAPNAWGLYDMHGNVWEWVWDRYDDYGGDAEDPVGPRAGDDRVVRGGSWFDFAGDCRAASRFRRVPGARFINLGFRPARSVIP